MPWFVVFIWVTPFAHPFAVNEAEEIFFGQLGMGSDCLVVDPNGSLWTLQRALPELANHQQGIALRAMAKCYIRVNDWVGAYDAYDQAIATHLNAEKDPRQRQRALKTLVDYASLAHEHGAWLLAETLLQQGLDLAVTLNDQQQVANLAMHLGRLAEERNDLHKATNAYKRSLYQWQRLNQPDRVAIGWQRIALLFHKHGQYDDALLAINRAINANPSQGGTLASLLMVRGQIRLKKAQTAKAQSDFAQVQKLYKASRQHSGVAQACVGLAKVSIQNNQLPQATTYLTKALAIYEAQQDSANLLQTHMLLGDVARIQCQAGIALREYELALSQAEALGNPKFNILAQMAIGKANLMTNQPEKATSCYQEAFLLAETSALFLEKQRAATALSQIYASAGRWQDAHRYQVVATQVLCDILEQTKQPNSSPNMGVVFAERRGSQRPKAPHSNAIPWQPILCTIAIMLLVTGIALWFVRDTLSKRIGLQVAKENRRAANKTQELEATNLRLLERTEEVTRMNRELYYASVTDALTGAYNRSYLVDFLRRELSNCRRHGLDMAFFMVDLDYFKKVNDTHGHLCGDEVLRQTLKLIQTQIRAEDLVARFGGEEFMVVLPTTNRNRAMTVAEKVRCAVDQHRFTCEGANISISISIGVSDWQSCHATSVNDLIRCADQALYQAKRAGRNQTILFHE